MWSTSLCFGLIFTLICGHAGGQRAIRPHGGSALKEPSLGSILDKVATGTVFSFAYEGKDSRDLLRRWRQTKHTAQTRDGGKTQVTSYRDEKSGVEVSVEIKTFSRVTAVECILYLRNAGTRDTGIFENVLPLNLQMKVPRERPPILHYAQGSLGRVDDYSPIDREVVDGTTLNLSHYVMNGTNQVDGQLPFFNLEWRGGGLIGAIGWSGQWAFEVNGESSHRVRLRAGQQMTHFRLHPGESIRTPRVLLLQWRGSDRFLGHNQFRKLLLEHYVPHSDGQIVAPLVGNSDAFTHEYELIAKNTASNPLEAVSNLGPREEQSMIGSANDALNWVNEKNQLDFIQGIPPVGIELYWLDAGWFPGAWPGGVGNWTADPVKFPRGLRPLSNAAHKKGLKFLLWFEPGRVGDGSVIAMHHPEWVLHTTHEAGLGGLFNFANPDALRWMTQTISEKVDEWDVDIYRQDSNICPLPFWRLADTRDREGITEIHWIEALYKFWDDLLHEHRKLMIDNANWRVTGPDIEVMSRSVGSLTRSETECGGIPHPEATQMQTEELSLWIPIGMGTVNGFAPYTFRSGATSGVGIGLDLRAPYVPLDQVQGGIAELKSLRPYWLGDYYPLTDIGIDQSQWAAWQFDRPDLKAGFAVFFRRRLSQQTFLETSLHGVDPLAQYDVTFAETYKVKQKLTMTGKQLRRLHLAIGTMPGSLLVKYQLAANSADLYRTRLHAKRAQHPVLYLR